MKRRTPADLLSSARKKDTRNLSWYDKLNDIDKLYVREVAEAFNCAADPPPLTHVAEAVKAELGVDTSSQSIARTIKELSRV
jgi:hypothetical protein